MLHRLAQLGLGLIATLLLGSLASAQNPLAGLTSSPDFLPVEEAYQLEVERRDDRSLRLYWQITEGYYLYQHAFKAKLEDGAGSVGVEFDFAPALNKNDEFFGEVQVYYNAADLSLLAERTTGRAQLSITSQGCADAGLCYPPNTEVFTLEPNGAVVRGAPDGALTSPAAAAAAGPTDSALDQSADELAAVDDNAITLLAAIAFAFLGGIILNAMPCVFPILSLKVLSFASGDEATHHRHTWWYVAGVVSSFVAVASVLIALQQAGELVGWGFQLQSPGFVIGLAYLFAAMALSLSGLVEFGTGLMNVGNDLAGQGGSRGSFFTGVLAVVVASPCTAPFMGSALGFALAQPAYIALLVFAALGLGMALPMLLLSYSKLARRALPKPGPWMETLKQLLAFPLYATVVWLLWVAGKQTGVDGMASALAGLTLLALALYLLRGGLARRVTAAVSFGAALALAANGSQYSVADARGDQVRAEGTVNWSMTALQGLRAEGVPVFVDVTADWCITCLANEQAVLFTDETRAAFEQAGVVYMVADWTNYDKTIGAFVKSHGRNGIPLYVMYPANPDEPPFLLPQLLSRGIIDDALARVSTTR